MAPTVRPRYQQVLSKGELSIYKTWIVCTQVTSSKPQGFGYYSKFGLILSENPKKSRPKPGDPDGIPLMLLTVTRCSMVVPLVHALLQQPLFFFSRNLRPLTSSLTAALNRVH